MSTLGSAVPELGEIPRLDGAPPGVEWNPFPIERPLLDEPARSILYHTNAASQKSSLETQRRLGLASDDATKPHYQVGLIPTDGAEKWLASNRRGIANGTVVPGTFIDGKDVWASLTSQQRAEITQHGRMATWSLAIETLDLGWMNGLGGATDFQGEMVARIFAYEALVSENEIILARTATWFGPGVGGHTDPFEFPFWTIHRGKTCPGAEKKAALWGWILPRAIEILSHWTAELEFPDDDPPRKEGKVLVLGRFNGELKVSDGIHYRHVRGPGDANDLIRVWGAVDYHDGEIERADQVTDLTEEEMRDFGVSAQ